VDARLALASDPIGGALVLHPNPSRRGDLNNPVVMAICRALQEASWTTLRFSMRAHKKPEQQLLLDESDAQAALSELRRHVSRMLVVGYSWGGLIATRMVAGQDLTSVDGLAIVSPAFNALPIGADFSPLSRWSRPLLLLAGGADDLCPREVLDAAPVGSAESTRREILDGVDHIWSGAADKAGDAVARFAIRLSGTCAEGRGSAESEAEGERG